MCKCLPPSLQTPTNLCEHSPTSTHPSLYTHVHSHRCLHTLTHTLTQTIFIHTNTTYAYKPSALPSTHITVTDSRLLCLSPAKASAGSVWPGLWWPWCCTEAPNQIWPCPSLWDWGLDTRLSQQEVLLSRCLGATWRGRGRGGSPSPHSSYDTFGG